MLLRSAEIVSWEGDDEFDDENGFIIETQEWQKHVMKPANVFVKLWVIEELEKWVNPTYENIRNVMRIIKVLCNRNVTSHEREQKNEE